MKNKMIRTLVIAVFATSLTAFAAPGSAKTGINPDSANCGTTTATDSSNSKSADRNGAQPEKNAVESERDGLIQQQDEQWLHDLQNLAN